MSLIPQERPLDWTDERKGYQRKGCMRVAKTNEYMTVRNLVEGLTDGVIRGSYYTAKKLKDAVQAEGVPAKIIKQMDGRYRVEVIK